MFNLSKRYNPSINIMTQTNSKLSQFFKQMTNEFPESMLADFKKRLNSSSILEENKKWSFVEEGGKMHITCNNQNMSFCRDRNVFDYDLTFVSISRKDITSIGITKKGCFDMLYVGSITMPSEESNSQASVSFFKQIDTKKYDLYLFKNGVDDYRITTDPNMEKYVPNYKIDIKLIMPPEEVVAKVESV